MGNPCVGTCTCPLCAEDGAEVREGIKGALYIVCDNCVSQLRTMSRAGRAKIAGLIVRTDPAPAPAPKSADPAPVPAPKPAPKPAPAKEKQPWFTI